MPQFEKAEEYLLNLCRKFRDMTMVQRPDILFLRRRGAPDRSLVTLQLSGKQICQAQGFNRRPITDQERRFLVQWGREKDIQIAV